MRTAYLVGYPGAGKTSALGEAIRQLEWNVARVERKPVTHIVYDSGAIQIGSPRAEMGGTDGLSMSVGPTAIGWVATKPTSLLVGEGDRLAYDGFLQACLAAGDLELIFLDCAPNIARHRAFARNSEKAQNAAWVKGRIKKVDNLIARHRHVRINADAPLSVVGAQVASHLVRGGAPGRRWDTV